MRKSRKWGWLAGAALLATGCYGPFNLTKRLHYWNGEVTGNKWANEGIFLAANIIPAYGLCTIADALVFNSVEFWTGKNWVSAPGHETKK